MLSMNQDFYGREDYVRCGPNIRGKPNGGSAEILHCRRIPSMDGYRSSIALDWSILWLFQPR
jgi:hypothetical protein